MCFIFYISFLNIPIEGLTVFRETKRNETKSYLLHIYAKVHYDTMALRIIPFLQTLSSLDTLFRKIPIPVVW